MAQEVLYSNESPISTDNLKTTLASKVDWRNVAQVFPPAELLKVIVDPSTTQDDLSELYDELSIQKLTKDAIVSSPEVVIDPEVFAIKTAEWLRLTNEAIGYLAPVYHKSTRQQLLPIAGFLNKLNNLQRDPDKSLTPELTAVLQQAAIEQMQVFDQKDRERFLGSIITKPTFEDADALNVRGGPDEARAKLNYMLRKYPLSLLQGVDTIQILPVYTDEEHGDLNGEYINKKIILSSLTEDSRFQYTPEEERIREVEISLDHEIGHAIHFEALSISALREWAKIYRSEQNELSFAHIQLGDYPQIEAFAESVAWFHNKPTKLQQRAPRAYNFFKNLFTA